MKNILKIALLALASSVMSADNEPNLEENAADNFSFCFTQRCKDCEAAKGKGLVNIGAYDVDNMTWGKVEAFVANMGKNAPELKSGLQETKNEAQLTRLINAMIGLIEQSKAHEKWAPLRSHCYGSSAARDALYNIVIKALMGKALGLPAAPNKPPEPAQARPETKAAVASKPAAADAAKPATDKPAAAAPATAKSAADKKAED